MISEENVSDQDDLCPNQEGHFKAPFNKNAVDSQLFSTPKAFRHCKTVSPGTEDEQSFNADQGNVWDECQRFTNLLFDLIFCCKLMFKISKILLINLSAKAKQNYNQNIWISCINGSLEKCFLWFTLEREALPWAGTQSPYLSQETKER